MISIRIRRWHVLAVYAALLSVIAGTGATMAERVGRRRQGPPVTAALRGPAAPVYVESAILPGAAAVDETSFLQDAPSDPATIKPGWADQYRATQEAGDAASFHWALIIGINDYAGGTRDNIGSYQDAVSLRAELLGLGWRDDHIMFIGNRNATRPNVRAGLKWLASKSTPDSVTIFHYSGHENRFQSPSDGDNEQLDVALWLSDNNYLYDGELGRELGKVRARRMWLNFAVCRAAGFDDPGTIQSGRVLTYSSPQSELSYEDPEVHHSVFGYNLLVRGMFEGLADRNHDGTVSVEEAFVYAKEPTIRRTTGAQHGAQHPVMVDKLSGDFDLHAAVS